MDSTPFVIERTYNAPIARVWKALTDKNEIRQWSFDVTDFKPEVGFEFSFYGGKDPNNPYLHICKVTEVEPFKKLTYSWRFDGHPGDSYVTYELFEDGDKTRLKLTHRGIETFGSNPDLSKENFTAGWTSIIGTSLKDFVEKVS